MPGSAVLDIVLALEVLLLTIVQQFAARLVASFVLGKVFNATLILVLWLSITVVYSFTSTLSAWLQQLR